MYDKDQYIMTKQFKTLIQYEILNIGKFEMEYYKKEIKYKEKILKL